MRIVTDSYRRHVLLALLVTVLGTPAFSGTPVEVLSHPDSEYPTPLQFRDADAPYDSRFLGVSYEYYSFVNLDSDTDFSGRFSPRRAGVAFTYGFPGVRLPRVRVGVGWEPHRPVYLSTGLELPLFERFSHADGRSFGMFLLGDIVTAFPRRPRVTAEATLVGLIPMGTIGGISVGAGITHRGEALANIGIMTGVFPMDGRN